MNKPIYKFSKHLQDIEELQKELLSESYDLVDDFSLERKEMRKQLIKPALARYFPSVQKSSNGVVYIYWRDYTARMRAFSFNRVNDLNQLKGVQKFGEHIPKLKDGNYSRRSFKKSPKWELEIILKYESRFRVIRDQSQKLKKVSHSLKAAINSFS